LNKKVSRLLGKWVVKAEMSGNAM